MLGHVEEHTIKRATFGMGCFWAGDSLFGVTPGVVRTRVGYAGGTTNDPTYKDLFVTNDETKLTQDSRCQISSTFTASNRNDHTEVIDIDYDPKIISYSDLLNLFWNNHEYGLTTRIKRQYMSLILWHAEDQRVTAEKSREQEQRERGEPLVTEIRRFERFYPAEKYHQKYRLQAHPWLLETLRLTTSDDLLNSPLAAKLNGYLAGAATISQFDRELPNLGLSEEAAQYVRRYVVESQGIGLYC